MSTIRIKFQKTGLSIFFSHLVLQKVMQRALKMSGLPVWYSKGFNPHIYMTFTLPLSLGHESECESVDFRLNEEMAEADILKALEGTLPQGIELVSAQAPDYDARSIMFAKYDITIITYDNLCHLLALHSKSQDRLVRQHLYTHVLYHIYDL